MTYTNVRALIVRLEHGSCVGKKAYMSRREVDDRAALSSCLASEDLISYQCPFCFLYHMGHPKSKRRLQSERKAKTYALRQSAYILYVFLREGRR